MGPHQQTGVEGLFPGGMVHPGGMMSPGGMMMDPSIVHPGGVGGNGYSVLHPSSVMNGFVPIPGGDNNCVETPGGDNNCEIPVAVGGNGVVDDHKEDDRQENDNLEGSAVLHNEQDINGSSQVGLDAAVGGDGGGGGGELDGAARRLDCSSCVIDNSTTGRCVVEEALEVNVKVEEVGGDPDRPPAPPPDDGDQA
eukprot:GHVL01018981.1.p2 GENE.GHVL01018981.1~~GHVL01018981.1.p2  ORF type:complete len:195 (-),score=87.26 GHVL01018981.1:377-961(-)